jgi:DNA-binding LytR/AlgR family response regulator
MNFDNLPWDPVRKVTVELGEKYINAKELLYIRGHNKHSILCFANMKLLETNHLLKWYEEILPVPEFCRCHDSYIVNMFYVDCMAGNQFRMQGGVYVPISELHKQTAEEMYEQFVRKTTIQ